MKWSDYMATLSPIEKDVGSHWRLSITTTYTQDVNDNSSTVTAKIYWEATDGYGAVRSSATKSGAIYIDGTKYNFTASAALSGNQKKLLFTKSKTINHSSSGAGDVTIDGYFSPEVELSGTFYGTVSLTAKNYTLPTIPRESTLTSDKDFTAGSNRTVSVSRASSSFTHIVYVDVKNSSGTYVNIKDIHLNSSETSESTSFSTAEHKTIFQTLNGRSSADVRWRLQTKLGDDVIGTTNYYGTVKIPALSDVSSLDGAAGTSSNMYVDQTLNIRLSRSNSDFTHTVEVTTGAFKKTFTSVDTSIQWTPSSTEQTNIYNEIGNGTEKDGNIRVYTYYSGVQVGTYTDSDLDFTVRSSISRPDFSSAGVTYKDTNTTTKTLTGSDQYIIQNKSTLVVTIPLASRATAKNGASMKSYSVTVNGITKSANYSSSADVNVDFGIVKSSTNPSVTIKAIDSRGFSTSVSKTITIIPYADPLVTAAAKRNNGFETTTILSVRGTASAVKIGTTNKNSIKTARYRYKDAAVTTWGAWTNLTVTGFPSYTATDVSLALDAMAAWNVQVEITDQLGVTTKDIVVSVGRPILFLDAEKKSVGIGDFPSGEYELKINGRIVFGSTMWSSQGGEGSPGGAIDLNNGDIVRVNGFFFNDVADNRGEGLNFLKTGKTPGSTVWADYDNFRILDGTILFNDKPLSYAGIDSTIWLGRTYPNGTTTINCSAFPLSSCPNGWIFIWSDYDADVDKTNNYNFAYTFVTKDAVKDHGTTWGNWAGAGVYFTVPTNNNRYENKYLYISNTSVTGHDDNAKDYVTNPTNPPASDAVLRKIVAF